MQNDGGYGYIYQNAITFLREKIDSDNIHNKIHYTNHQRN
jgi:hypothetical protein